MKTLTKENVFSNRQNQVEMIFSGYLDNKVLLEMLNKTELELNQLAKKQIKPQLLVNVTDLYRLTSSSRRTGTNWIMSHKELCIAIYGKNIFMKHFVNFLIIATGRSATMKFFTSKKAAKTWLNSLNGQ